MDSGGRGWWLFLRNRKIYKAVRQRVGRREQRLRVQRGGHVYAAGIIVGGLEHDVGRAQVGADRFQEAQKRLFGGDQSAFPKLLYSRTWFKDGVSNFQAKVANDILGLPKEDLDEATKIAVDRNEKGLKYH